MAYFDWNATTPVHLAARQAWLEATDNGWGNPSASYQLGVRAKLLLDQARSRLAGVLKVADEQVVFTSGATESNNAILRIASGRNSEEGEIWISSVEHPSVREASLKLWGTSRVKFIPVTRQGVIEVDWIADQIKKTRPVLLCLMAVNNETGVIQPLESVAELCRGYGIPIFSDAVQWLGKVNDSIPPEYSFSMSAHKFGGLKGTGCLVLGQEWMGSRLQYGGGQESGSRAGTEDVAGICAMVAALLARMEHLDDRRQQARDNFEDQLVRMWPEVVFHGKKAERVWNTSSVSLPEFPAQRWISRLDRKGFQVSSGAACSAGTHGASKVLSAMGVDGAVAARTVRISSGWETSEADWTALLEALVETRSDLKNQGSDTGPATVIQL